MPLTDSEGKPLKTGLTDADGNPLGQPKSVMDENVLKSLHGMPQGNDSEAKSLIGSIPVIGSLLGGAIGGPVGAPLGTVIGSAAKQELQNRLYNEGPKDAGGSIADMGKDVLLNDALPAGLNKVVGGIGKATVNITKPKQMAAQILASKSLRQTKPVQDAVNKSLASDASKMTSKLDSQSVEEAATGAGKNFDTLSENIDTTRDQFPDIKTLERSPTGLVDSSGHSIDNFKVTSSKNSPEVDQAIQELDNHFGKNKVGQKLIKLKEEMANGVDISRSQTYNDIINTTLSDITHVRNFKIATGDVDALNNIAINKVMRTGYKDGSKTVDPDAILNELSGKSREIYGEALKPETRASLEQFAKTAKDLQGADNLLSFQHGKAYLGIAALGGLLTGHIGYAAKGVAGVYLGKTAITKLMANPEIAQLTIQAMKTPTTAPESKILGTIIKNALRGTDIYVNTEDGDQKATFDQNGQLSYPQH